MTPHSECEKHNAVTNSLSDNDMVIHALSLLDVFYLLAMVDLIARHRSSISGITVEKPVMKWHRIANVKSTTLRHIATYLSLSIERGSSVLKSSLHLAGMTN